MYFPERLGWADRQLPNTVTSIESRKKTRPHYKWLLAVSALVLSSCVLSSGHFIQSALAESAAPGAAISLDTIVVQEANEDADGATQNSAPDHDAREKLEAMAGGTALITAEDKVGRADLSISDSIGTVPGVIVQNFFGAKDQPRVQIRGSGLQQNPVERGILMLQNGLPLNRADGSYIIGLADPGQAHAIEIFRGYTANRLGATVLGGAINFISPDGSSQPGATVNVEAGSFGLITTSLSAGGRQGKFDAFIQGSYTERDGYRDFNSSERTNVNLNVGAKINQNISTRVFLGYTDLSFDVTGPLPWVVLQANPKQAYAGPTVTPPGPVVTFPGPNVIRDLPKRETEQFRIGSRTSAQYDDHLFDLGLGYSYTDDSFIFPIAGGIRDTEGGDFSSVLRYSYSPDKSNPLPLFEATANYVLGSADRDNYLNINGNRGAQFGESELDASTLSLHAGMHIPLGNGFTIAPAVSYSYATRDNDDLFGTGARPVAGFNPVFGTPTVAAAIGQDTSYDRSFSGWSPSLGLTYKLAPQSTLFGSVSRSFEPPTHGDLLATINGTAFSSPGSPSPSTGTKVAFSTPDLDAQTATTIEAGWRGKQGRFTWDVVSYYSWVDDELLNLRDASGVSLGAVNADKTTHFGIELGASARIIDGLSARVAYTYQDFRFDGDATHGDNRLAGAPRHTINGALRYTFSADLFVEAELNWRADDTPVDNANTLFNEDWVTVDLRSSYRFNEHFSIYGEIRNVFDETYASSTLITDVGRADQAAFIPGDGRAFIIGLKTKL